MAYGTVRLSIAEEKMVVDSPGTHLGALAAIGRARERIADGDRARGRSELETARTIDPVYLALLPEAGEFIETYDRELAIAAGLGKEVPEPPGRRSLLLEGAAGFFLPGSAQLAHDRTLTGSLFLGADLTVWGGILAAQVYYQDRLDRYAGAPLGANFDRRYRLAKEGKTWRDGLLITAAVISV
ncbi:hypothetical protein ACFL6C_01055, partial [Myxococcota bacterium]